MFFLIIIALSQYSLHGEKQVDELVWQKDARIWNDQGIQGLSENIDNKPLTFLALERFLGIDHTLTYTRLLNIVLIAFTAVLVFSITKRYESFLFVLIPVFLNSMWLTVEIIELPLILLATKYKDYSGLFVGLAVLFRPYSILYSFLLKKRQVLYIIAIGAIFSTVLLYYGLFFPYLHRVISYGSETEPVSDYIAIVILIPLLYIGMKNKEFFKYGLLACVPLLLRTWAHYFITPYGLFLTSYLSEEVDK